MNIVYNVTRMDYTRWCCHYSPITKYYRMDMLMCNANFFTVYLLQIISALIHLHLQIQAFWTMSFYSLKYIWSFLFCIIRHSDSACLSNWQESFHRTTLASIIIDFIFIISHFNSKFRFQIRWIDFIKFFRNIYLTYFVSYYRFFM